MRKKKAFGRKLSSPKLGTIVLRSGWSFLGFALFPTSRIEVFFSLKGVARLAVRLVLVSDRWESWLSQVADAETKQAMRQHPHLSKLFFHNIVSISKIDDAKLRTIRGKFAKKCLQTCEFNKSFDNVLSFTTSKNGNFKVSESPCGVTTTEYGPSSTTAPKNLIN